MSGLDDLAPFDEVFSGTQIEALLGLLGPGSRVLDLGSGGGRTLVPLVEAGHHVRGLDRDPVALRICQEAVARLGESVRSHAEIVEADFTGPWPRPDRPDDRYDAVTCLGNTIMTLHVVDDAIALFARAARVLRPQGLVVIDDVPQEYWPELTEGGWTSGVSADGAMQLVWAEDDAVFALREGEAVDEDEWDLKPSDRLYRLWTRALLDLTARCAGLSETERVTGGGLLIMRPRGEGVGRPLSP